MVRSPLGSYDPTAPLKLLCSYDGKILPRHPDGRLRYVGGETRVLSVPRFLPFSDLLAKLSELYGSPVSLRCQLPTEDLDALVSITSDEDFANLVEEYDKAAASPKIRAFLCPLRPKTPSPPGSTRSPPAAFVCPLPLSGRCVHHAAVSAAASTVRFPLRSEKFVDHHQRYRRPCVVQGNYRNNNSHDNSLVHNGKPWQ